MVMTIRGLIPGIEKTFLSCPNRPDLLRYSLTPCSVGTVVPSRVQSGRGVMFHSPPARAEGSDEWSYTSISVMQTGTTSTCTVTTLWTACCVTAVCLHTELHWAVLNCCALCCYVLQYRPHMVELSWVIWMLLCCATHGVLHMVCWIWCYIRCVTYGVLHMAYCIWCAAHGVLHMVCCIWCVEYGVTYAALHMVCYIWCAARGVQANE